MEPIGEEVDEGNPSGDPDEVVDVDAVTVLPQHMKGPKGEEAKEGRAGVERSSYEAGGGDCDDRDADGDQPGGVAIGLRHGGDDKGSRGKEKYPLAGPLPAIGGGTAKYEGEDGTHQEPIHTKGKQIEHPRFIGLG